MEKEDAILINYEESIVKTFHSTVCKCRDKLAKKNRKKRKKDYRFARKIIDEYRGVDPTTINEGVTLTLRDAMVIAAVYEFLEEGKKIALIINDQGEPADHLAPPSPAV